MGQDDVIFYFYGFYYHINHNFNLAIKYYLIAIDKGNSDAMNNLARYYEDIGNHELAIKYYEMAIKENNTTAMYNLGLYYDNTGNNYKLVKKYYHMAIDNGNISSTPNLAIYYHEIENNYELAEKYYLMSVDNGDVNSMIHLATFYKEIKNNYELEKKYYLMAANQHHQYSIDKINDILHNEFNIELAFRAYRHLDKNNLIKFNHKICDTIKLNQLLTNSNESWNIVSNFNCTECKTNETKCVFQICGHAVCIDCFSDVECSLCNK